MDTNMHGGTAVEEVNLAEMQKSCFRSFIGCLNWCLKNNKHTEQLVINYQGTDCRITECYEDGTCLIDMPGAQRQKVALKPEDCARLQCVMCEVPFHEMAMIAGGHNAGGLKG